MEGRLGVARLWPPNAAWTEASEPENHRKGLEALKLALEVHRRGQRPEGG